MKCTVLASALFASVSVAWFASAASADTLIVLNKAEATASLIDPNSGQELARLPTGIGPHEVAVAPDGRHALVSNYGFKEPGNSLTLIDISQARAVRTFSLGQYQRPHGILWLQPDLVAVTAEAQQSLLLLTVSTGNITAIGTGQNISHMVAVTPTGDRAFVANIGSGSVSAIDLRERKLLRNIVTGKGAEGIAVTPDGKEVWISNREANTLTVLDAATLTVRATLSCGNFPIRVLITPDGRYALISNAKSSELAVFDVARRKEVRRITFTDAADADQQGRLLGKAFAAGSVPVGILIPPEGPLAYVAHTNADKISVVNYLTGSVVKSLTAGKEPDGLGWSMLVVSKKQPGKTFATP